MSESRRSKVLTLALAAMSLSACLVTENEVVGKDDGTKLCGKYCLYEDPTMDPNQLFFKWDASVKAYLDPPKTMAVRFGRLRGDAYLVQIANLEHAGPKLVTTGYLLMPMRAPAASKLVGLDCSGQDDAAARTGVRLQEERIEGDRAQILAFLRQALNGCRSEELGPGVGFETFSPGGPELLLSGGTSTARRPVKGSGDPVSDLGKLSAQCASGHPASCSTLAEIAMSSSDELTAVQERAARALEDQALLARVATEAATVPARRAAVSKLQDASLVSRIAQSDPAAGVRAQAVRRLEDPVLLAEIAMQDLEVRSDAVANPHLTDARVLAEIATNDTRSFVREGAASRLTDPARLVSLALSDPAPEVRAAAVKNPGLTAPSLFQQLATRDPSPVVRQEALRRISSEEGLAEIAKGRDVGARRNAAQRLSDPRLLSEITKTDADKYVRAAAARRLAEVLRDVTDPQVLTEVAESCPDPDARKAAIQNQHLGVAVLARILRSETNVAVKLAALARVEDGAVLAEVARADTSSQVRWAAIRRPGLDQGALVAATTDPHWQVRLAAIGRLDDQTALGRVARGDALATVRYEAAIKVSDPAVLRDVAQRDASPRVRAAAKRRLAELAEGKPVRVSPPVIGEVRRSPKDGLEYAWIPPGDFEMGCVPSDKECDASERPRHRVRITHGFWLARTEVPWEAFLRFASLELGTPYVDVKPSLEEDPRVLFWDTADRYCRWVGGRLPTEAEWEYAARGGQPGRKYVWGDSRLPSGAKPANLRDDSYAAQPPAARNGERAAEPFFGGYDDGYPKLAPVGRFAPNGFGLYDMAGNLAEWTADWYAATYYVTSPPADPTGPDEPQNWRVVRGGSYKDRPARLRLSDRFGIAPGADAAGLRCALDALP